MGFRDVFGHESAKRFLQARLSANQLPGALLLTGVQGIGKTTLALAYAEAAACLNPRADPFDACGLCDSCRRAKSLSNPEVQLISPAGDQTQIWQFWDRPGKPAGALQHSLNYAPVIGRRRVYIVERAESLTEAAANSLLKVLEEPPTYAFFVLLASHAARVLPTVVSRSQLLRLSPVSASAIREYLINVEGVSSERSRALAGFSEGRIGTAIALTRNKGVGAELSSILDLAVQTATSGAFAAMMLADQFRKQAAGVKALANLESSSAGATSSDELEAVPKDRASRRQFGVMLNLFTVYYRDLLSASLRGNTSAILNLERGDEILRTASRRPPKWWALRLEYLMRARRHIEQNGNPRLIMDALAVRLIS